MTKPGKRVQLHRALSKLGWGSRKQAWDWICAGEVRVDGRVITDPLTWVDVEGQKITRGGVEKGAVERLVIALHKPVRVVTTRSDERGRKTVYDLLPPGLPWIFPAGRLDADSEGLLILTNDARLAERLTDPVHHVAKTYRVTVRGEAPDAAIESLRAGVTLDDGPTRPCVVTLEERAGDATTVSMILREGRNRQIRRMWESVGHPVTRLLRVAVGGVLLGELPAGHVRTLAPAEVDALTAEPSSDRG